ncbi:unnamed protein product [Sphagnum jensenii]
MKDPAIIFRALADPTRRDILKALKDNDRRAGEIVEMFTISAPAVSRHLSILKAAELVSERRESNHLAKSLTDEGHKVISIARGLDQRNAHALPKDLIEYRAIGTSNEEELLGAFEGIGWKQR